MPDKIEKFAVTNLADVRWAKLLAEMVWNEPPYVPPDLPQQTAVVLPLPPRP